ncbi:rad24p [Saccharomyces arboricola H-6]|uniref:Rad24p n=1 Tax=Saccharomyces arboricola (strain H-6 / AS 2.3317 / CBS 10644) TaxID=1160507 RepID=J8Q2Q2_SACAR|nr:rad24p [Saccharomyces arboricola H-6]
MDISDLNKRPSLQYSLSSLSTQITKWSSSRPTSPVRKNKSTEDECISKQEINTGSSDIEEYSDKQWYERYKPIQLEHVAIHKKKLKDVRDALEAMFLPNAKHRILLLSGPSGCSKSTVIKQLSKVLVPKYRRKTQVTSLRSSSNHSDVTEFRGDSIVNDLPQMESFSEFLKSTRYLVSSNLSLILIEDLPNVFHRDTRYRFQQLILQWLYSSEPLLPPLVICLTECEIPENDNDYHAFGIDYTFSAETVMNKEILTHPRLKRIKFNPINSTLLKKHLKLICTKNMALLKENNKWSKKEKVINQIALETGDIRSAITTLQFWATSREGLPISTRESTISYFHAIGKVIHGSHNTEDDNELINTLFSSAYGLLSNQDFKLGILENYSTFNKGKFNISDASSIVDCLSECDTINSLPESNEYSLRKVRKTFRSIAKESHNHGTVYFPREWKVRKLQSLFKVHSEDWMNVNLYKYNTVHSFRDITLQFGYYAPFIRKLQSYKKNSMLYYIKNLPNDSTILKQTMNEFHDLMQIEDDIDIIDRVGGPIGTLSVEDGLGALMANDSNNSDHIEVQKEQRDRRLRILTDRHEKNMMMADDSHGNGDISLNDDPIVDSDGDDSNNIGNDTLGRSDEDESLYEMLSQRKPRNASPVSESLSDSDLELL